MLQQEGTDWLDGWKNKTHIYTVYKKPTQPTQQKETTSQKHIQTESERMENIFHANGKQKEAGATILVSDEIDLKIKITRDKEEHNIVIKGSIQ